MTSGIVCEPTESVAPADGLPLRDAHELDDHLAHRTRVPLERLDELIGRSATEIHQDAAWVSSMLRHFAEAVVDAFDDPSSSDKFLRDLDLAVISRDHDWRQIFAEIREASSSDDDGRRCLLIRYLEYLGFRKRLIEFLHSKRAGLAKTGEHFDLDRLPVRDVGTGAADDAEEKSELMWWEDPAFLHLTTGGSATVALEHGTEISLVIGGHRSWLCGAEPPSLRDADGTVHPLKAGRNIVGRHPRCDVVLTTRTRLVSRVHLIVLWDGPRQLTIIDLSSKGTFVPVEFVA